MIETILIAVLCVLAVRAGYGSGPDDDCAK